ncbi:MAG: hypothetical protein EOO00_12725, partial [Chitinophagaceae bacterium]
MKHWAYPTKFEWTSFLAMMPVLSVILNQLLFPGRPFFDKDVWIYSFPVIVIQGTVSWYLHIAVMHYLRIRLPHIHQTTTRLVILGISHVFLIWGTFVTLFYAYDASGFLGYKLNTEQLKIALLLGVALTLVATT